VSLHCLPSDWKELWAHCCYWLWAQIPPHLHLKHVGFPLISQKKDVEHDLLYLWLDWC
jgi:hypothetical protein